MARIAAVARGLFAERGYRGVGVDEIARRAGVTPPVLYDHFDSKRDLYAHLLERQARELATRVERATGEVGGGKARLRAAFDAFFALVEEQPLIAGDRGADGELGAAARRPGPRGAGRGPRLGRPAVRGRAGARAGAGPDGADDPPRPPRPQPV